MFKMARSKYISFFLVFSFILFCSPDLLVATDVETGNMIGFVYAPDRTTPLEGAVLMLRNISTGAVYESSESDSLGTVRIEGVERGLYITGINFADEFYNLNNLIGIRANSTAKVSVALDNEAQVQEGVDKKKKGLFTFFAAPVGLAIISAFALGATIGFVTLSGATSEASPYK